MHIEQVIIREQMLALILRHDFDQEGIHFFTPGEFSQQLAYMKRPKGYEIEAHVHNEVPRNIKLTQEVLFIKKGKVRVDFYDQQQAYCESRILGDGDVILLVQGGHGFTMLEESEMIEVKQGPYTGDHDKSRFTGIKDDQLRIKG